MKEVVQNQRREREKEKLGLSVVENVIPQDIVYWVVNNFHHHLYYVVQVKVSRQKFAVNLVAQ